MTLKVEALLKWLCDVYAFPSFRQTILESHFFCITIAIAQRSCYFDHRTTNCHLMAKPEIAYFKNNGKFTAMSVHVHLKMIRCGRLKISQGSGGLDDEGTTYLWRSFYIYIATISYTFCDQLSRAPHCAVEIYQLCYIGIHHPSAWSCIPPRIIMHTPSKSGLLQSHQLHKGLCRMAEYGFLPRSVRPTQADIMYSMWLEGRLCCWQVFAYFIQNSFQIQSSRQEC